MKSIKDKDGNLKVKDKIKDRWKENYVDLYNMNGPSDTIIQTIPSTQTDDIEHDIEYMTWHDIEYMTWHDMEEVATALKHLKEGKAEEMKATGKIGIDVIHKLCRKIWETEKDTWWLGKSSHRSNI